MASSAKISTTLVTRFVTQLAIGGLTTLVTKLVTKLLTKPLTPLAASKFVFSATLDSILYASAAYPNIFGRNLFARGNGRCHMGNLNSQTIWLVGLGLGGNLWRRYHDGQPGRYSQQYGAARSA